MNKTQPEISFRSLGTEIYVRLTSENDLSGHRAVSDLRYVKKMYGNFEKIFSRFVPESELSKLNRQVGEFTKISPDLLRGISRSIEYHEITNGFFDPRIIEELESAGYREDFSRKNEFSLKKIGGKNNENNRLCEDISLLPDRVLIKKRIDLSGMVKGYVTDVVADFLLKQGWKNFLIDSGGDLFVSGLNQDGDFWKIEIEGLSIENGILALSGRGIATSGITRKQWKIGSKNYHHLINPHRKKHFSFDLSSVTVIAASTEAADVFAKALFLMGPVAGLEFATSRNLAALFLDKKGQFTIAQEMKKYLVT